IALSLITSVVVWRFKPPTALPVVRFSFSLPDGQHQPLIFLRSIGISPDGSQIVYGANKRLYVRSISESEAKPIQGTETEGLQVTEPVFSPDGTSILFSEVSGPAERTIKKTAISGGVPVVLYRGNPTTGLDWEGNDIVFSDWGRTVQVKRISSDGGKAETLA